MTAPTVERPYSADEVERLRGSVAVEHTLARLGRGAAAGAARARGVGRGARRADRRPGRADGARPGLQAIYLSGWQVAADANLAGQTYPDQSLYPASSAPALVERINNALLRADQIAHAEGDDVDRLAGADRRRRRGRVRRAAERVRADEGVHRGRRRGRALRGPALRRRRSAGTSAARCSCRARSSCARSSRRASRPTCSTCRRC